VTLDLAGTIVNPQAYAIEVCKNTITKKQKKNVAKYQYSHFCYRTWL